MKMAHRTDGISMIAIDRDRCPRASAVTDRVWRIVGVSPKRFAVTGIKAKHAFTIAITGLHLLADPIRHKDSTLRNSRSAVA